ncbi:MAG TPA: hypothetical protein VLW55_09455 [Burkholderiaceae bacterium]|nr:hypothetical protein [Burkholderiaceae bacterium]
MSMMRDAVRSTRGRIVIGAVVAFVVWKLALVLLAPGKVVSGFTPNARGQVNVLVTLRCMPERFHVLAFQQYGRVSGTHDDAIEVRGVSVANLNAVARPYWVKRVEPLPVE